MDISFWQKCTKLAEISDETICIFEVPNYVIHIFRRKGETNFTNFKVHLETLNITGALTVLNMKNN